MLKLLLSESRLKVIGCGFFSLGSGAAIGGAMILVSEVIAGQFFFSLPHAAGFFALVILAQVLRYAANVTIISLVETLTVRTRLVILEALRASPLERFEQIATSRIHNVLTTDCAGISQYVPEMIEFFTAGISLLFCLCYLVWLSPMIFFMTALVLVMGIGVYLLRQNSAKADLEASRSQLDRVYKLVLDFMGGFKELKMNRDKSKALFDGHIQPGFSKTRNLLIRASRIVQLNYSLGLFLFFSLLGFVVFVLPHHFTQDRAVISKIVVVLLYMVTPGGQFLYSALQFTKLKVALDNLEALKQKALAMRRPRQEPRQKAAGKDLQSFKTICLQGLSYRYDSDAAHPFEIGPLSAGVARGQITFITGGNGSGKTTLLKLLTGLYAPSNGQILVDDTPVDPADIQAYRSLFSVVFSDFFLFEKLYGLNDPDQSRMQTWLDRFSLSKKLTIDQGRFSTDRLSSGQRRRLALFCAVMEDRPVLVCDEMTADQEPGFREYFYTEFLPQMKAGGKTLILITHDDRYFHLADKVIKLEYGRLEA